MISCGAPGAGRRLAALRLTFVICFPLVWALSTSLKPKRRLRRRRRHCAAAAPTLENYRPRDRQPAVLPRRQSYVPTTAAPQPVLHRWFLNSVVVSLGSTAISILDQHARGVQPHAFPLPGRAFVLRYFSLLGYMVAVDHLRLPDVPGDGPSWLTDTLWSLTFGYVCITLPFCMWLMWAFFRGSRSRSRRRRSTARPGCRSSSTSCCRRRPGHHRRGDLLADRLLERLPLRRVFHQLAREPAAHRRRDALLRGHPCRLGPDDGLAVLMTVPMAVLFMLLQRHLVAGFGAGAVKGLGHGTSGSSTSTSLSAPTRC